MDPERKEEIHRKHEHKKRSSPLPVPEEFIDCEGCELLAALDEAEKHRHSGPCDSWGICDRCSNEFDWLLELKHAREVVEAARKIDEFGCDETTETALAQAFERYDEATKE